MTDRRRGPRAVSAFAALALLVLGGHASLSQERKQAYRGLTSKESARLDSRVRDTLFESGVIQCGSTTNVLLSVRGGAILMEMAPEGTIVKKGDVVARLDSSEFVDEIETLKTDVAMAEFVRKMADDNVAAVATEREAEIAAAQMAVQLAELEREKYLAEGGDYSLKLATAERDVAAATERLEQVGLSPKAKTAAQSALKAAESAKRLLTEYDRKHQTLALDVALAQAKAQLLRTQRESRTAVESAQGALATAEQNVEQTQAKLKKAEGNAERCTVVAPADGMVIYSQPSAVRLASQTTTTQPGDLIKEFQQLAQIADMSKLQVRVLVNETQVSRVLVGQPVAVELEAFPERDLRGSIVSIARSPEPLDWFGGSVKKYAVIVSLDEQLEGVRSGMTALAKIDVAAKAAEK